MRSEKLFTTVCQHLKTQQAITLDNVFFELSAFFIQFREGLIYFPGIISSDGDDLIPQNSATLIHITKTATGGPTGLRLCSPWLIGEMYPYLFELRQNGRPEEEWLREREALINGFWRRVFALGCINAMVMTPRWTESSGCKIEYQASQELTPPLPLFYAHQDSRDQQRYTITKEPIE